MLSYNPLVKNSLLIVNSFIIKLHPTAVSVNNEIEKAYGRDIADYISSDLTTWRHYKNMAGEYHSFDNLLLNGETIKITLLEDLVEYPLTKELLNNNLRSKNTLMSMGSYYFDLLDKYPNHETLIKGIIFPIDMTDILLASDGTILYHNPNLIERQEYTLIKDVEREIKRYLERWNVVEYTIIDDLYVASVLANVISLSVLKIMNHRISKLGTYEVHSYHMNEFFKSNFALGEYTDVLSPYAKMWLYKNLKYLIKNIGREETLNSIIENLFVKSGIRVTEIVLKTKNAVLSNEPDNLLKPSFNFDGENLYEVEHGGNSDLINKIDNDLLLSEELHSIDNDVEYFIKDEIKYIENTLDKAKFIKSNLERTKIINLDGSLLLNMNAMNFKYVIFENWLKLIDVNENYANLTLKTFTNKQTGLLYKLTAKEASLILIKTILYKDRKLDTEIKNFTLNYVVDVERDMSDLYDGIPIDDDAKDLIDELILEYPNDLNVHEDSEVKNHFLSINKWYLRYWMLMSNLSLKNSNAAKVVLDRLRVPNNLTLLEEEGLITTYLDSLDINVKMLDDDNANEIFDDLIMSFIGIETNPAKELKKLVTSYKNILESLTSYSVHLLSQDVDESITIPNISNSVVNDLNAIDVKETFLRCLEAIYSDIDAHTEYNDNDITVEDFFIISYKQVTDPNIDALVTSNGIEELNIKITAKIEE